MSEPWLIVGLGNPGPEYAATRHNVGAMAVEVMASGCGSKLSRHKKVLGLIAETHLGFPGDRVPVVLCSPLSYMNESGGPVKAAMSFYRIPPERLVVLHDELDIDFTALRLKKGGGDGGHNGLKSIRRSIGTGDYFRVRLGIGRPPEGKRRRTSSYRRSPARNDHNFRRSSTAPETPRRPSFVAGSKWPKMSSTRTRPGLEKVVEETHERPSLRC